MDTLVIPVQKNDNRARKIAIQQIFSVFKKSDLTLVLDAGLEMQHHDQSSDNAFSLAAMCILSSGWMRRLWTLQEAFLSKKIYFVFKEAERSAKERPLDLEELLQRLDDKSKESLHAVVLARVNSHLRGKLMHDVPYPSGASDRLRAAMLLANTWQATRWRVRSPDPLPVGCIHYC